MATLFADIKTPYINELTLKRVLAPRVKENIFQSVIFRPEEACTDKFSSDTDAAEIQVIRIKPDDREARELGATTNGGWFNNKEATQPASEAYGIKIITVIDHNIDIPTNAQSMLNVDLVDAEMKNLSGKVARNVNALTLAAQLCKNFNDVATSAVDKNWVELTSASVAKGGWKNAMLLAGAKLDEGNESQGIDLYPSDQRAYFVRPSIRAKLMQDGELIIGGSNYAQEMQADGGLSHGAKRFGINGFAGYFDGVPVYVLSNPVFDLAAKYLGKTSSDLSKVYALLVSGIGTGRALAFNSEMKIIDSPNGQGRRLQPKYRMGAECWDALSVVPIVETGFTNPSTSGDLKVMAPGSRA